jgi:CRP/FNR family transcriptional regulator, cyclic AMP receptor protein
MSAAESSLRDDESAHHALFPWFPAHRVQHSEEQMRAEELLANIPLFIEVPRFRLRAIAQVARRNSFRAGEVVFRMGELGSTLHVIRSGRMDIVRESESGDQIVLASLGPGEFFGELSLFDRGPRSATVIAAEDTRTLSLGRADILDILNRYPEVALAFLGSLCERLRTADNLLENAGRTGRLQSESSDS